MTLSQLFRRFVMLESVDDVVCEKCTADSLRSVAALAGNCSLENNTKRSSFVKKLTIGKVIRLESVPSVGQLSSFLQSS